MGRYEVQQGDCIASIAEAHGFFWETLWNHPDNAPLRDLRKNPNVLAPGDQIEIPALRPREDSAPTDKRHRYVRRGVPSRLRLKLMSHGKPRARVPFDLIIDQSTFSGRTDADGVLDAPIPPGARAGELVLRDGGREEKYTISLGHLDPISSTRGAQQRLRNLSIPCEVTGEIDEQTEAAVKQFQGRAALEQTGKLDDTTRQKLLEMHGS